MKKLMAILLVLVMVFALAACGSSDALKGTWTGEDDLGAQTWTFDGSGKCTYTNDYFSSEGTYIITESKITINLEMWENEKIYDFTVSESNLKLNATDGLSPDFDLTKK